MPIDRPERGRRNEEGAWGFGLRGISEGLRAFGARGISKGLGAWAPSRNAIFPLAGLGEGKGVKTKS